MAKVKIIDRDTGLKDIVRDFSGTSDEVVAIGVQGTEANKAHGGFTQPITNLELWVIHEFGAPGASIPERSVIRATVDRKSKEYFRLVEKFTGLVVDQKMTVKQALGLLGEKAKTDMQRAMDLSIGLKALKASTERRRRKKIAAVRGKVSESFKKKGAADIKPLVDTGQMKNALTWTVRPK
jgi:hypothetical protein